jgi:hypothetical protein
MKSLFVRGCLLTVLLSTFWVANAHAAMSVSLIPSVPPPVPVGAGVVWDATALDAEPGRIWYRFRIRDGFRDFRIIRDYGPDARLIWVPGESEGFYDIEVSARNVRTGETAEAAVLYEVTSRVHESAPVVSETPHPLVWLYSAPPCPAGSRMRVRFRYGDRAVDTPDKPCRQDLSMNFYLAGLRPGTEYSAWHTVYDGAVLTDGPLLSFTTAQVALDLPGYEVIKPHDVQTEGILLQSNILQTTVATDLEGHLVWFYPLYLSSLTRPREGGFFFGVVQDPLADSSYQILREFDVVGQTVRETNAARISEQLVAQGKRPITSFHHEAASMPDGKILALAGTEEMFGDSEEDGLVNVLGDTILVLDENLQVVWAWDSFDHLDPARNATLSETCTPTGGGCPPFYFTEQANDWLHGNSVQLTPDNNLLFSIRHQDWVLKIDYRNGEGSGEIIWRLGSFGDFSINSKEQEPWFSHQHDAHLLSGDSLLVLDNGNVRAASDPSAHSRGQLFTLDEERRSATLVLNFDLGGYSPALGSAQKLSNGNYHFNVGWLPGGKAVTVELDSCGNIVYAIEVGTPVYRSFRMLNIYSP